jgi:hypothetical protein
MKKWTRLDFKNLIKKLDQNTMIHFNTLGLKSLSIDNNEIILKQRLDLSKLWEKTNDTSIWNLINLVEKLWKENNIQDIDNLTFDYKIEIINERVFIKTKISRKTIEMINKI